MNELSEGAKVVACWTGGKNPQLWNEADHKSIVVKMQPGLGSMNPWIEIVPNGEYPKVVLINCASLEGVKLAAKEG